MAVDARSREADRNGGAPDRGLLAEGATVAAVIGFSVTLLWSGTDRGYFWPIWVWFGLAVILSLYWLVRRTWLRSAELVELPRTGANLIETVLTLKLPLVLWSCAVIVAVWLLTGTETFWPRWPLLSLLLVAGIEAYTVNRLRRRRETRREEELTERVGELTRTRRGALEVQAEELRRVERDLHDGAQSRLVALQMQLGRAEAKLGDTEETREIAALVREARAEASATIADLRDLARGIAPPVLADRGLEAATRSLVTRATGPVTIEADLAERPATVIEKAAYFVIAESITNATKHATGAPLRIELDLNEDRLRITVTDDGPGGADPAGSGLSGLRQRVEALDGRFEVRSPAGQGTTVTAELPRHT